MTMTMSRRTEATTLPAYPTHWLLGIGPFDTKGDF